MSAPAANARSDPVSTMQPTDASTSRSLSAVVSSRITTELSAFSAFGRLRVTSATRSWRSIRIVS